MTISSITDNRVSYSTNGVTTDFSVTFPFLKSGATTHALKVIKYNTSTGAETVLTENSDYTVTQSSGDPSTGTVTISPAIASGYKIYILPKLDATQAVNLENSTAIDMPTIEKALDKLTLLHQLQEEKISRAIILGETTDVTDIEIPSFAGNTSKVVTVNSAEDGFEYKSVGELTSITSFDLQTLTASTSLASTDYMVFADGDDSTQYKATIKNVVDAAIDSWATITETDTASDKLAILDATDGEMKLVAIDNLGLATGGPDGSLKSIHFDSKTDQQVCSLADSFETISGLSITMTPASTQSKNLIVVSITHMGTGTPFGFRIKRNGSVIETPYVQIGSTYNAYRMNTVVSAYTIPEGLATTQFHIIDEPNTDQEITYTVEVGSLGTQNVKINSSDTDTNASNLGRGVSTITLLEVL